MDGNSMHDDFNNGGKGDDLKENTNMEEKEDFSSFYIIIKEMNSDRSCPNIFICKKKKKRYTNLGRKPFSLNCWEENWIPKFGIKAISTMDSRWYHGDNLSN